MWSSGFLPSLVDWEADNVVEITGGAVVMTLTEREKLLPAFAREWVE